MRFAAASLLAVTALAADYPNTPAGAALHTWLDAFNSADRAQITAYFDQYEPTAKNRIPNSLDFRDRTGGFDLIRIEKNEPRHLEAVVKERGGSNFARLKLDLNDADPPRVLGLDLNVIPPPAGSPEPARLPLKDALKALDDQATELTAKDRFSGVVLVAKDRAVLFEKAYGLADRAANTSNSMNTRFRIGSMNKMFTATAILQLIGEGKIDLAKPLGTYLTDYPNKDVATKVTIRHLLTHTGGTGDIFTPEYDQHRLELKTLDDYLKLYGARGLEFEPGSKWSYSNYGFVLLGAIIEKVTGVSYYDYVRKHIYEPAGMTATASEPETEKVASRSLGYMRENGKWIGNQDTLPWRGTSAGGGYSTAADLMKFAEALTSGKLIKPDLLAQMTSKQAGDGQMPPGKGYGFGMILSDGPETKHFGHGGGAPGMNGELRIYPRTNTIVVILANLDPPAATRLADYFDERMPAK